MKIKYFSFLFISIISLLSCKSANTSVKITYIKNENLECIKKDYPGNQLIDGRFVNDSEYTVQYSFSTVIKWMLFGDHQKQEKKKDTFSLRTIRNDSFLNAKENMIVWLGQASFFIRIDGETFLTDPCLTHPPFVKRLCGLPCRIEDMRGIDYLLISHNHMDHLDSTTLKKLDLKHTTALVPLRLGPAVRSFNKDAVVQEAGWYQKYDTENGGVEVYLMPAKHNSGRSPWNYNKTLWGSFIIKGKNKIICFSGDVAYSHYFSEISRYFPGIDVCLMVIGAYCPEKMMKDSHASPGESVQAFNDLKGRIFIPHHYGTFEMSDEPLGEPLMLLRNLEEANKIKGKLKILDVGEVFYL